MSLHIVRRHVTEELALSTAHQMEYQWNGDAHL